MTLPKIIHQIWIGPKPMPVAMMNTWKEKNPDFEYILWTEEEIQKRGMIFQCQRQIDSMEEYCGKADIMRYEILFYFGGIFIDADSVCLEPLDDTILSTRAFASYENEHVRRGLLSNGTIGFIPHHPLCEDAIYWIYRNRVSFRETRKRPWEITGPVLLTRLYQQNRYPDFTIFPSYFFLPRHYGGTTYRGHGKVYADQAWGSTFRNYSQLQDGLPIVTPVPSLWISVLVSSYNTNVYYVRECLQSLQRQRGHFGIELVWINDGSHKENTFLLEQELKLFLEKSRFIKLVYHTNPSNRGIPASLNIGLALCSHEWVARMDSDDIMHPDRLRIQLDYLLKNPECVLCGSDIQSFMKIKGKKNVYTWTTNHPKHITPDVLDNPRSNRWFMNGPTLFFRKEYILNLGGYDEKLRVGEDHDLEMRVVHKYGYAHNIKLNLLYYRLHSEQITAIVVQERRGNTIGKREIGR
jgi:hypothetical protein